jgi:hypothetical protein
MQIVNMFEVQIMKKMVRISCTVTLHRQYRLFIFGNKLADQQIEVTTSTNKNTAIVRIRLYTEIYGHILKL